MTGGHRLAVVSGGGTGIGRAVTAALAADGADVVIIGRRLGPLVDSADAANKAAGADRVRCLLADLREPADVGRVADEIVAGNGGHVDVLVNNAGGNFAPKPAEDLAGMADDWLVNITGNVFPVVLLTQALLPALRRPGGRIITITSIAAFRGPPTYGGSKAALHSWNAALASQLAGDGITVNAVAPGYVAGTEFYRERMSPEFHAGRARQSPMNRGGSVEEIGATVTYLASELAGYVTGQIIQVNGGALLGRG